MRRQFCWFSFIKQCLRVFSYLHICSDFQLIGSVHTARFIGTATRRDLRCVFQTQWVTDSRSALQGYHTPSDSLQLDSCRQSRRLTIHSTKLYLWRYSIASIRIKTPWQPIQETFKFDGTTKAAEKGRDMRHWPARLFHFDHWSSSNQNSKLIPAPSSPGQQM